MKTQWAIVFRCPDRFTDVVVIEADNRDNAIKEFRKWANQRLDDDVKALMVSIGELRPWTDG